MRRHELLDSINQRINDVADKFIKFKICYAIYLATLASSILLILAIFIFKLNSLTSFNENITTSGFLLVNTVAFLYIYLGYIKYANLIQEPHLRKTIITIIALWAAHLILSNAGYPIDWIMKKIFIASILSTLLFYLAFKKLKNSEGLYFQKLSKLNLYMFIFHLVILAQQLASVKYVIFISYFIFSLLDLVAFYWEIKLFWHLYRKYEKTAEAAV